MNRSTLSSKFRALAACSVAAVASIQAQAPDPVQKIRASAQFTQASTFIDADYDRFVKELIVLNECVMPCE